ncbi:MAG: polysaccharide pyruvyl transferase family protein [Candidatus Omnitrophota bacterium]
MGNRVVSEKLFSLFKRYRPNKFVFVKPGGNYGDELIYKGAEKLALLAGLDFTSLTHEEFLKSVLPKDTVIYIHGGGGFVTWWSGSPEEILVKAVSTPGSIVISGPQTFWDNRPYLSNLTNKVKKANKARQLFIFTRERASYEAIKDGFSSTDIHVEHDHDTAFNLESPDLVIGQEAEKRYCLFAVRQDRESPEGQAVKVRAFALKLDPINYCQSFHHWVDLHARSRVIIANRLHSAVLGHILKIPTILLGNNYHKNRSVWEYSLESRDIKWIETAVSVKENYFDEFWSNSYLQRGLRLYYGIREKDFLKRFAEK